ncbi:MAG TPA: hypothetical protein VLC93_16970, partial [Myxococcota bacterium]|nr:hypothetical protein [Myxococcota bacterium]
QFKPPNNEAPPPAPPPPPAGLPVAGPNVEPNVLEDGRRILREAIEDDDTDDLARFLRELRNNNSPTVVRGVAIMLFQEAGQQHDKGGMSTELFLKIKELIDTTLRGVPPTI